MGSAQTKVKKGNTKTKGDKSLEENRDVQEVVCQTLSVTGPEISLQ